MGATRYANDIPRSAAAKTKQSPMYFMIFKDALGSECLLFTLEEGGMRLSMTSIVIPMGQTMEQKNRPKMIVSPTMTVASRREGTKLHVVMIVVMRTSGSILRKRSTGTGRTSGKTAYHRRTRKTQRLKPWTNLLSTIRGRLSW
jgi:hypothetical protein